MKVARQFLRWKRKGITPCILATGKAYSRRELRVRLIMNCPYCGQVDCAGAVGLRCGEIDKQLCNSQSDIERVKTKEQRRQQLIEQIFALSDEGFKELEREFWRIHAKHFNAAQFDADLAESDE
jgi:hypothetical protein